MDEFQSEKEQIDEIRKWWKDNGNFVITGLVLGVVVLGGLNYWKSYKIRQAENASAIYNQLMEAAAASNLNAATGFAGQLDEQYASTPYAIHGRMAMASLYVSNNEPERAAAELRDVISSTDDEGLEKIARLRLAKVLLMQDKADEALATLAAVEPAEFAPLYHEIRGDAFSARDEPEMARQEYQAALDTAQPGLIDRQFVEMKLNDLLVADPEA